MYNNEHAFSKAFCQQLHNRHIFYQRIESGGTSVGIPDLYVRTPFIGRWIELKCMHNVSINDKSIAIPWRPGQKAWALRYVKACGEYVLTICALKDGFILIRMYEDGDTSYVDNNKVDIFTVYHSLNALMEGLIKIWL